MEIEVGEYVRTKMGTIGKFKYYGDDKENIYFKNDRGTTCVYEKEIVKHSPNIIDLIEVGDYVNDCKVYENHKTYLIVYQKAKSPEVDYNYINYNEIKSIVTKEMMKSVEYRIN